jgi:hypothetical protein
LTAIAAAAARASGTTPAELPSPAVRPSRAPASSEVLFILPGGHVGYDGIAHHEVELSPVTGDDEYYFACLDANAPRAAAVTELLGRCVKRVGSQTGTGAALVRDLLVGDRNYLVLKLREMTFGKKVSCVLRCPDLGCGAPMDLSLDPAAFGSPVGPVMQRFFTAQVPISGGRTIRIEFRLPTGGDQEALAALFAADPAAAEDELFARCLRRPGEAEAPERMEVAKSADVVRGVVEQRMSELGPTHAEAEIETRCPECGKTFESLFDLTAFFLDELRANLRSLEREVHFLAWHYHWSERDILSMTRKRRRRYVALLQEEVDRLSHVW